MLEHRNNIPQNTIAQPQSLLPYDKVNDRPLSMILVIMTFLATLTLLAVASGQRAAAGWHDNLSGALTVQIKPAQIKVIETNADAALTQAQKAQEILRQHPSVETATILPTEYSRSLLKPWLGDTKLPDDLPIPILIDVRSRQNETIDTALLSDQLRQANIRADIDDHRQWDRDIKRTTRAAQTLSLIALALITLACITAAIFATRAGLTSQRKLINVLHQVGASPNYTARLMSTKFARSGLQAGGVGALLALLVAICTGFIFSTSSGFSYFMPGIHLTATDLYTVLAVPIILSLIIAVTTWRTVMKTLYKEIYP